jgi:DNA mismatch endonuclease (patch repair protein)
VAGVKKIASACSHSPLAARHSTQQQHGNPSSRRRIVADLFSPRKRSQIMRAVLAKDTTPEIVVRRLLHALGYRYRLHCARLPGKPDLVFAGRGKVIFVHGCFWHQHRCARGNRLPKTHRSYWTKKLERNRRRDRSRRAALRRAGWRVLIVWECQTKDTQNLAARLCKFLDG